MQQTVSLNENQLQKSKEIKTNQRNDLNKLHKCIQILKIQYLKYSKYTLITFIPEKFYLKNLNVFMPKVGF